MLTCRAFHLSSKPRWPTSSSRRSTLFCTATDVWDGCSSRFCCARRAFSRSRFSTLASISKSIASAITNSCSKSGKPAIGRAGLRSSLKVWSRPPPRQPTRPGSCWSCLKRTVGPFLSLAGRLHLTLRVHQMLQKRPLLSVPMATKELGLSKPTVAKAIDHLVALGIVREITAKQRRRIYAYVRYLDVLNQGTEPLS